MHDGSCSPRLLLRAWSPRSEHPKRRTASVKRSARGREERFLATAERQRHGGGFQTRLSTVGLPRVPSSTCRLEGALFTALFTALFARLLRSLSALTCAGSRRPTAPRDLVSEARARGQRWPARLSPPAPAEPTARGLGGTMLESIRVTGECGEELAYRLAGATNVCPAACGRHGAGGGPGGPEVTADVGSARRGRSFRFPELCGARRSCSGRMCGGKRENGPFSFVTYCQ